ncbi:MAG: hypothetical protein ABW061_00385 [Polyangiaceae bacterium]
MPKATVLLLLLSLTGCDALRGGTKDTPEAARDSGVALVPTVPVAPLAPTASLAPSAQPPEKKVAAVQPNSIPEQIANELGQLGVSTSAAGLQALGAAKGRLLQTAGSLASRTPALGVVLNNDSVVNAFVSRLDIRADCEDENALRSVLEYALQTPTAQQLVQNSEAVTTLVDSKLAAAIRKCPAFQRLAANPNTLSQMVSEAPATERIVNQPNFKAGLTLARIKQNPPAPVAPAAPVTPPAQAAAQTSPTCGKAITCCRSIVSKGGVSRNCEVMNRLSEAVCTRTLETLKRQAGKLGVTCN